MASLGNVFVNTFPNFSTCFSLTQEKSMTFTSCTKNMAPFINPDNTSLLCLSALKVKVIFIHTCHGPGLTWFSIIDPLTIAQFWKSDETHPIWNGNWFGLFLYCTNLPTMTQHNAHWYGRIDSSKKVQVARLYPGSNLHNSRFKFIKKQMFSLRRVWKLTYL